MSETSERERVAIELFTAYCEVRQMNPADWPIIGEVKQAAWRAAADVAIGRGEPRRATSDRQGDAITDSQIQSFAHAFVRGIYRDHTGLDHAQALSVLRAILGRIVGEQVAAVESLGGLGDWSRDSLGKLLSDAAEIELTQVLGAFSEAFASAMAAHAGPTAEPTSRL